MRHLISTRWLNDVYNRQHGVRAQDISPTAWRKSSWSSYYGNCFEIARLQSDRVGVKFTKDNGTGPVLIFNQNEWSAFLARAKAGNSTRSKVRPDLFVYSR